MALAPDSGTARHLSRWRRGRRPSDGAAVTAVLEAARRIHHDLAGGLDEKSAARVVPRIRELLGADGVVLTDLDRPLASSGTCADFESLVARVVAEGRPRHRSGLAAAPVVAGDEPAGVLAVAGPEITGAQVETMAGWVGDALDHARLESARERLARAELRTLRAQISPHFIYNSMSAITSLIRSDPEQARELLVEFAQFTRYSFTYRGDVATVAEEFRAIETYLRLERARFGPRLRTSVQVAPEVLPVTIPYLVLQPLVENSVRHGIEKRPGPGTVTVTGAAIGPDCVIAVEDDGVGMEPETAQAVLAGRDGGSGKRHGIGLANVDQRLRAVYGPEYGLVVETAPGEGTKVTVRVPRSSPGMGLR